jgi:hypothetical protein
MVKTSLTWTFVAAGAVAALVAVRRLRGSGPGSPRWPAPPVIGGDTWPPVPVNPDRPT